MAVRISLCMIVKNEAANLPGCLGSVAGLVDEIIVVDTGSSDQTTAVARRLGAQVFPFAWVDDFAAARNESVRHATGDWIFWIDGDEQFDQDNRQRFRALRASLKNEIVAYMVKNVSLPNPVSGVTLAVDQAKLFPNHPRLRWRYRVHEQILPALEELGGRTQPTDLVIRHLGYHDPDLRRRKNERNLRLLQLAIADQPDDVVVQYLLGWALLDLGRPAEAVPWLQRSLAHAWPGLSCVGDAYGLLAGAYHSLGQSQQALATCLAAQSHFPGSAGLLCMEGVLRMRSDPARAEACLRRVLQLESALAPGIGQTQDRHSRQARLHLADLLLEQNRPVEAEAQWRAVLAEAPNCANAWLGLAELWRTQGRLADLLEAEQAAGRLRAVPHQVVDGMLLQALVYRARKQLTLARQLLEETIARAPEALMPRQMLSFVILDEGQDWAGFERALRDILRIAPDDAQARHNLGVLLRMQGRPAENPP